VRSFWRIIVFLLTAFHLLTALAFLQSAQISLFSFVANQVLASAVLTYALLSIAKECIDIWASFGIILRSTVRTGGFITRLTVKSAFALYLLLLYVWSLDRARDRTGSTDADADADADACAAYWSQFCIVAAIYLTPFVRPSS
jgi:hypothetical protein